MKITVLGTRGEIEESAPYHSKKSGVLINNELLLDIGDPRFLKWHPKAILITHLHPDHAYFVREQHPTPLEVPLYGPESYDDMNIHVIHKKCTIEGYTITPLPTIHSQKVASQAYLIEYQQKRLLYTGDLIWLEKKYQKHIGHLDLVITEGSFLRKGGMVRSDPDTKAIYGHTGIPNLITLFKQFSDTILLVHFGGWFYKNMKQSRKDLEALAQEHDVTIIVGYDGLEIEI